MSPRLVQCFITGIMFCCAGILTAPSSRAQESPEDPDLANYAFAHYLGTGVYSTSGQAVQVYQVPLSYTLREVEGRRWGVWLRMPVTAGFYDFGAGDLWQEGLPDEVATMSLVPGGELQILLLDNWVLAPGGDYGIAKNFTSGESVNVYSASLRSRLEFHWGSRRLAVGNKLLYAKHTGLATHGANDFSSLETGLDLTQPLTRRLFGQQAEISLYAINFRYFDDLTFLRPAKRVVRVVVQNEVGITLGLVEPMEWQLFDVTRLGLGVRFGNGLTILRLVVGSPF